MKHIVKILFLSGLVALAASCDNDESGGVVKGMIRYPSIILEGDELIFINEGETYSDAGAKAFLGEDDITADLVTEEDVDTSSPGIYYVDYSSTITNELGQEASAAQQRTIIVLPAAPNTTENLSGTYERSSNGAQSVWTKLEDVPGLYTITNVGGVDLAVSPAVLDITAYAFHFADGSVVVPEQRVYNGILSGDVTYEGDGYTIVIHHANFGTNDRVFVKQ